MTPPRLFPTQEIGSIARPRWQLKAQRGEPLDDAARAEWRRWNEKLRFVSEGPEEVRWLAGEGTLPADRVRDLGALFAIRYFESAGLDRVYDGEARRVEMYEHPIRRMRGFEFLGHVRSFDSKYYRKAAATGPVELAEPYDLDEFAFVRAHTRSGVKVPVTGPYTLADWSYLDHYLAREPGWHGPAARRSAQRAFVLDLATKAIRPTLKALIARGAEVIQIDEPAAGTHPSEAALVAEAFNAATEGLDAEFSMHICFSDYAKLFPAILEAKRVGLFALEFANRDAPEHDGYTLLKTLREHDDGRRVGLGVVDVHRDAIETPELVAERIGRAARYLGDPGRLWINPDCGLRTRSLEVAYRKLTALVDGAALARRALEGPDAGPAEAALAA